MERERKKKKAEMGKKRAAMAMPMPAMLSGSRELDVDDAVEHGKYVVLDVDSLVSFMEAKLASTRGKLPYRSTIFTVPGDIRNIDAAAYSPKVVSIGLLQQEKRRLDEHKWHYLDKVLSRRNNNLKMYIEEMKETASKAVCCYPKEMQMSFKESEKMMLVDGCFIINLLLQLEDGLVEINDPIFSDRWTLIRVGLDMLLLENQLPFFVLEKLWELTDLERPDLRTIVLKVFRILLPEELGLEVPETEDVHHLLHFLHLSLQPASSSKKPESTSGTTIPRLPQPGDTLSSTKKSSFESPEPLQPASPTKKPARTPKPRQLEPSDTLSSTKNSSFESPESFQPTPPAMTSQPVNVPYEPTPPGLIKRTPPGLKQIASSAQQIKQTSEARLPPPPKTVPSATELQEAGVKFQKKEAAGSFLDVTFERGLMQIPRLTIYDSTNSLFRNLIAFEQGFPNCGSHFTSYCIFMDSLINTRRDVEILKQSGIIEHVLGSDKEVALLFNKLCKGITWDFENSYLAKVFKDVSEYNRHPCHKWRAKLVRDYFSNPWAILSLIAAIVILILTFLQTYFAVFAYFKPP